MSQFSNALAKAGPFAAPRDLPGLKNDRASIGDQNGIVRVDGIQTCTIVLRKVKNFRAGVFHQIDELLMIARSRVEIGSAGVAETLPLFFNVISATKGLLGPLHDDAL